MVNSYNPDPRLPPEKQLIPTVAKRLQQEKWEQEGTFGTAYDKDFRPLNDSSLMRENSVPLGEPKQEPPAQEEMEIRAQTPEAAGPSDEWPLKAEAPKSPPQVRLGSSYSTMPKISDMQAPKSPLPGQRPPMTPQGTQGTAQSQSQLSEKPQTPQRIPIFPTTKTRKAAAAAASSCKSELCKQAQRCSFISSSFSLKATANLLAFTHVIITRQLLPKSINQLIRTYREHSFSFFSSASFLPFF